MGITSVTGIEPRGTAATSENSEDGGLSVSDQAGGEGILGVTPRSHSSGSPSDKKAAEDRRRIFRALEIVERDSAAIAESYASLFFTLRLALSEVTNTSVENMQCLSDVVGSLQVSALNAATNGNRYINSCLRLNEEMKSMEGLSLDLKMLRKNVDALELAVNQLLRFP